MTLFGLVLDLGGAIPFFALYKKWGRKLFILNVSTFGFTFALAASGFKFFNLFVVLSLIVTLACIFIFCFRPNLVISIKNKMGAGEGPVDIRRDENLNRSMEMLSFVVLLAPVVLFFGRSAMASLSGGMIGSILQVVLPVILLVILFVSIMRVLQNKNDGKGLDSGFAEVFPTEETENAIREIGAMIIDIQKLGDFGIEKWAKKRPAENV
jgi:hypothetical protein